MRLINFASKSARRDLATFCEGAIVPPEIVDSVAAILADVRARGDAAVADYAHRFDGAALKPSQFKVRPASLAAAAKRLPADQKRAMKAALANVKAYNQQGLPQNWTGQNAHGAEVGERHHPIRRVGLYVPGGQVPLVSTVLMTATLAKIAGCPEIAVFTPSNAKGEIADGLLAALHLIGITEVYRIGGVHAIGAMAYGTKTIPAVDKVFGPGNAYTCEAKRQVFGTVGVDSLPGPSEVMVIADESARVDFAAADLLAQAEHGSGREKIYLVTSTRAVADAIHAEVQAQLPTLGRNEKAERVLDVGFLTVVAGTAEQMAEVANYVAPEHLELLVKSATAKKLERTITTAGAMMIGNYTATALGDFTAGPSHVLPTGRAGRFFSGLRVADFLRRTSIIRYDAKSIVAGAQVVDAFAKMEQLDAHGRSATMRVE